jgi:hypothetical protein
MQRNRLLIAFAMLVVIAAVTIIRSDARAAAQQAGASTAAASLPEVVPISPPVPGQTNIDVFSWKTFIALMRPAALDGNGRPVRDNAWPNGKPDLSKPMDARGPRVWEGMKADHELFRHGGKAPVAWDQYDDDLPCSAGEIGEKSGEKILTLLSEGTSMQQGVNQAMAGPLIDRFGSYVHYEVRHNKPYYDTVKDNKYYLRSELNKHRWPKKMIELPISDPGNNKYGSLEIKAAWRVLDPSEDEAAANRYYWTWARIPNPVTGECGPKVRVAMVGLHIIQKVQHFNQWLWATFEHVDNVPCNYTDPANCPPPPARYSFNDKGNTALDDIAKANRGYAPRNWSTAGLTMAKWRPLDPKRPDPNNPATPLPREPIAVADRIHAIRMLPVEQSADDRNREFHAMEGIRGTWLENYILIDTQWPVAIDSATKPPDLSKAPTDSEYVAGAGNPEPGPNFRDNKPVANITMETFYQQPNPSLKNLGASCMQCHYSAAQTDFSYTLTNRAWPPTLATKPH